MNKKITILFSTLAFLGNSYAQTGIGTTAPVNKFEVVATTADPASSGSSANGNIRIGASASSHVLDFGLSSSSNYAWLQARLKSNYATNYSLVLNPNGGSVGIGNTAPSTTLTVGNETGTIGGEILLNPTTTQHEGGQIVFKRSRIGSTVDWTIDQYGTTSSNARFRIFNGASESNGLAILENGNVGLGTASPTARLNLDGGGMRIFAGFNNSTTRPALSSSTIGNYEIRGVGGGGGSTQADGADDGFLRLSAGGGSSSSVQSSIDLSGYSNVTDMNRNIVMRTSGTERLRINSDGYIGVGTSSPLAPLHVASSASQFVVAYGFLSPGGTGTGTYNQTISYSIQADGRIRSNEFNAISDIRIKKNIVPLKSNVQLLELNNLRVVNYSYIDQLANGNSIKTGFIAQEVEKVNDRFVNKSTEFIPSVFALVKSALVENEVMKIITEKPHGFVKGDVVKFFAEGKKEVIKTIDEVESANEFIVSSWKESTNNLFIYGKKITDFMAIDFDQITALSVGAIQELSKQIDSLKLENEKFKKKQSDFEARLLKLESKLN
jgi:hypothetical protein